MKKEKASKENNENIEAEAVEINHDDKEAEAAQTASEAVKVQLEETTKKCDEYLGMLQRTAAEFDNYKKRTVKEKEAIYSDAVSDVLLAFLPVIDSMDRALEICRSESGGESIKEGMELVGKQIKDALKRIGINDIKSIGESFDPQIHNAVMHVDDDAYGQNTIVEEYQKGYMFKDKVIRHSMVKVAN